MGVNLDKRTSARFIELRKKRLLSQEELRQKAKVSLRTVQNLESGNRPSFSESTLIALCRALDISYDSLWVDDEVWTRAVMGGHQTVQQKIPDADRNTVHGPVAGPSGTREPPFRRWLTASAALVLVIVVTIVLILIVNQQQLLNNLSANQNNYRTKVPDRFDWIEKDEKFHVDPAHPGGDGWDERMADSVRFRVCNYIEYEKTPKLGDSIEFDFQWTWYYASGNPEVFISVYAEWDPDTEIRVFHGDLAGEGTKQAIFTLSPPPSLGRHKARLFYAEAFAAIPSFYGAPPPSQVTNPSFTPHLELVMEVLP